MTVNKISVINANTTKKKTTAPSNKSNKITYHADKKQIPFQILQVLKDHSCEEAPLSQKEISDYLSDSNESYGGIAVNRNTIKANLDLLQAHFPDNVLSIEEKTRRCKDGEEQTVTSGWFWNDDQEDLFELSEARYLSDSVLASKRIPFNFKKELLSKIRDNTEGLEIDWDFICSDRGLIDFNANLNNPEYLLNLEVITDCIREGWFVCFQMGEVGRDGKFIKPKDKKSVVIDPDCLLLYDGNYYLVGHLPNEDDVVPFRIDFMYNAVEFVDKLGNPLPADKENLVDNLDDYKDEHLYMLTDIEPVELSVANSSYARGLLFEKFGNNVSITSHASDYFNCKVKANAKAIVMFVAQHHPYFKIVGPEQVLNMMKNHVNSLSEIYKIE